MGMFRFLRTKTNKGGRSAGDRRMAKPADKELTPSPLPCLFFLELSRKRYSDTYARAAEKEKEIER
jgi:hypothetical protein